MAVRTALWDLIRSVSKASWRRHDYWRHSEAESWLIAPQETWASWALSAWNLSLGVGCLLLSLRFWGIVCGVVGEGWVYHISTISLTSINFSISCFFCCLLYLKSKIHCDSGVYNPLIPSRHQSLALPQENETGRGSINNVFTHSHYEPDACPHPSVLPTLTSRKIHAV